MIERNILTLPIGLLPLSVRARNALRQIGAAMLYDLRGWSPKDFDRVPNVGRKTVAEIFHLYRDALSRADDVAEVDRLRVYEECNEANKWWRGISPLRRRAIWMEQTGAES